MKLCKVCGDFYPVSEFEIVDDVCKWCDVTIRDNDTMESEGAELDSTPSEAGKRL